jgi:hypothetical protein
MRNLLYATTAIAVLAISPAANANNITITGFDGTTIVSGSGSSPAGFNNIVGDWTALGTAIGTPPAALGKLLGNTTDFHNTGGAGTFTLWITETDLTGPLGLLSWFSSLTTNQLDDGVFSVKETTSLQTDNSTPGPTVGLGQVLDTMTFTASNQVQTAIFNFDPGAGPYSITEQFIVSANGVGDANLTIDMKTVPEPISIALLGAGLVGLGWAKRKRAA